MSGILQLINTFPSGGFAVKNSLRFRSSASAYLNRTPASTGSRTTWTWSGWVKLGSSFNGNMYLLSANTASGFNDAFGLSFASWSLSVSATSGGATTMSVQTTQIFRDFSSWYHLVIALDTTQATAANRIKIYVNGTQVTALSATTYPAQNASLQINNNVQHYTGALGYTSSVNFDGYMAEVNFIDGQALTPSSFGAFDATSGVWQATKYSGTYGTNGFYLKFSDTTSTTTLCYDYSGNGNNWTPNNISLTSGSTYDSMLDSPTNYDNGGNGVGNYAVLNAVDTGRTLSNANLTYAGAASGIVKATFGISSGKWYWEFTAGNTDCMTGLCAITLPSSTAWIGSSTGGWGYYGGTGLKYFGGSGSSYGASYTTNDVIGVAFDADAGTLTFYKNNTSQGAAFTGLTGATYCPANGNNSTNDSGSFNFGQRPFAYTPPTGFKALNTQNLPAVSIQNGASFMAATLYTGNGSTQNVINAVNGVSFQPDFVWVKDRTSVSSHDVFDSVRGATKWLYTNGTAAEGTYSGVTAFNSNGFSLGSAGGDNASGDSFIAWQWKANGTAVTNNAGSITSQASANTTAGFSVATFTAPSSGTSTVGHGLGIAPSMIIAKVRNVAGTGWAVYHSALPNASYYLQLNTTDAQASSAVVWNSTAPTSSVFSLGSAYSSSQEMVAYCFAAIPGYSAFGSYTGNGSSDGPFVFCGFRPRYLLIKLTGSISGYGDWRVLDSSRNTYNVTNSSLSPNSSGAEDTNNSAFNVDFLSNGFKLRTTYNDMNASGYTYIYAAFAENPLKYSLAR